MLAIRMQRKGRAHYPTYRIVVQESQRHPLSGRVVAEVGNYNPQTNRKMLEVLKINNVEISQIIDKITEDDLYNIDILKKYGINTEEEFILSMGDGNSVIDFDIFNLESDDKVFYKEHEINENITIEELEIENGIIKIPSITDGTFVILK